MIFYFHTEISVNHVLLKMYQSSLVYYVIGVEYYSGKFVAGFNFPQDGKLNPKSELARIKAWLDLPETMFNKRM